MQTGTLAAHGDRNLIRHGPKHRDASHKHPSGSDRQKIEMKKAVQPDTFTVIIEWIEDSACFVAGVPDLPGCVAKAQTRAGAVEAIDIAIHARLQMKR